MSVLNEVPVFERCDVRCAKLCEMLICSELFAFPLRLHRNGLHFTSFLMACNVHACPKAQCLCVYKRVRCS